MNIRNTRFAVDFDVIEKRRQTKQIGTSERLLHVGCVLAFAITTFAYSWSAKMTNNRA